MRFGLGFRVQGLYTIKDSDERARRRPQKEPKELRKKKSHGPRWTAAFSSQAVRPPTVVEVQGLLAGQVMLKGGPCVVSFANIISTCTDSPKVLYPWPVTLEIPSPMKAALCGVLGSRRPRRAPKPPKPSLNRFL